MSITVLNYLDQSLVNSVTEQAAARAKAAAVSADKDFSTVLDETTQALTSNEETASASSATSSSANLYTSEELETFFNEAANTYGVSSTILKSIAKAESNFNPSALSSAGAVGIMQLMPATAASLGVSNSYDAKENIFGGAKYISQLLSKYQGNISLALAAYNAGSANVEKYGGIPPFTETQNYVQKVLSYMNGAVTVASSTASSIFNLTGSARSEANQMIGDFLTSKNISKETLDLLALLLKVKNSVSSGTTTTQPTVPSTATTTPADTTDTDFDDTDLPIAYTDVPIPLPVPGTSTDTSTDEDTADDIVTETPTDSTSTADDTSTITDSTNDTPTDSTTTVVDTTDSDFTADDTTDNASTDNSTTDNSTTVDNNAATDSTDTGTTNNASTVNTTATTGEPIAVDTTTINSTMDSVANDTAVTN